MNGGLRAWGPLAAVGVVLVLVPMGVTAAPVDDGQQTRATAGLHYEVTALQQEVAVGEKLGFRLELYNDSDLPVTVFWPAKPYVDVYRFAVTSSASGRPSSPQGPSAPIGLAEYFRQIPPGWRLEYSVLWSMPRSSANCQEYTFQQPGTYTLQPSFGAALRASFDPETGERREVPGAWTGTLEGMPIQIRVLAPSPTAGVKVEGQALDAEGKPVEGAMVVVEKRIVSPISVFGYTMAEAARTFTGHDGRFSLGGLSEAEPFLDLICSHPFYRSTRLRLSLEPPKLEYEVRLDMDPGITLRGRVVSTDGRALAGAGVSEDGEPGKHVYTDEPGAFELRGTTGRREVHVFKPGYQGDYYPLPSGGTETGDWQIVLRTMAEATVSGRATFRDGRPAANMDLSLALTDPDGKPCHSRGRTDGWGRFRLALSRGGPLSGTAWIEEQHRVAAGGAGHWQTAVEGLTPSAGHVELTFDDSGAIEVSVEPAGELPASVEFAVHCSISGREHGWLPVAVQRLGAAGGTVSFGRLSPGRYRTQVVVTKAEHWNWTQDVELPADQDAPRAPARYPLPELLFGNLRARVLEPDGRTPFADGRAWLDHTAAWGSVEIKDGRIELNDLPVGQAWLTVRPQGYARTRATGMVHAGETTDLGDIVLTSEEAGTGWVEGRILYDDGSPALGAAIIDDGFAEHPVEPGGRFRWQLPAGRATLPIALKAAYGWPEAPKGGVERAPDSGFLGPIRLLPWTDIIFIPADVKAGQTVEQDVVLRRQGLRTVRLAWMGDVAKRLHYAVYVDANGQRFVRSGIAGEVRDGEFTMEHVPAGTGVAILRTDEYAGHAEWAAEAGDVALIFDPANAGRILGRARRANGEGAARVRVVICPAALSSFGPVEGIRSTFWPVPYGRLSLLTDEDGAFHSHDLGPGSYVIHTSPDGTSAEQTVQLGPGQTARVDLITSAASGRVPPLRSTDGEPRESPATRD